MKLNKLVVAMMVAAAGFVSAGAQATVVNVGGVQWDNAFLNDFSSKSNLFEITSGTAGANLNGYGFINQINGKNYGTTNTFLASPYELTYEFGGFTLTTASTISGFGTGIESNGTFTATGGWLKVYLDNATTFDETNKSTATNGTLWLGLQASSAFYGSGITLKGSITGQNSVGLSGQGVGYFDVIQNALNGGLAWSYLDTNSEPGGADFTYTSEFQGLNNAYPEANAQGNNTIFGKTAPVPEPGSIALVGLGLLGLCFGRRNKKAS